MWPERRKTVPSLSPVLYYNSTVDGMSDFVTHLKLQSQTLYFCLSVGFLFFSEAKWWWRAPCGEGGQRHTTTLQPPHQPQSAPSFLIHLTVPSIRLVPPFHNFKALLYPLPLGWSCPPLDHTDIHTLFRAIRPPRSALNLHFHSWRQHCFFISPFFSPSLLLFFAAHCTRGSGLLISWGSGAIACAEKGKVGRESQNIQGDIFSHRS